MDNHSTTTSPEPPVSSTLWVLAERAHGRYPAVRLLNGPDALILGAGPSGVDLLLLPGGETSTAHPEHAATLIADPGEQAALLRQATAVLSSQAEAERLAATNLRRGHARTLGEIRDYAIARHVDGDFCRDGLNKFLAAFGLDPYCPRLRITYTITGSYELDGSDRDHAERDARGYLKVDHNGLDHFIDDSNDHTVTIDTVDEVAS